MKRIIVLLALSLSLTLPAFAASKEIVELQVQMQQVLTQLTALQRGNDERLGSLTTLVQQNTDAVNKMSAAMDAIQKTFAQQSTDAGFDP